ncbi:MULTISPECIES: aspartyl/asparaginyl beta-hydroxylase domain-containing protein [unclassified Nostoc]|uniref:aspartyl/asparaginyl beta-hydroxylase domain-containing protein n=1 Tax=unclassified Nostoc TaxID=2593658 RepID=UPI0025AB04D3|nr:MULTISPECIES: aspartyl/asparaginyl beta-hydroxylase domain-containing protein [unclassified Nostoc]MDM9583644.1 aspartyl/asparaginyl beta-hydroxylase domain-containing protein [Nostoc sp. GT001]MDZ7945764.1 aspartyl/asparaginyl beta-hydroxylase domain-containing protein [Nostoc sp. EfeVER01]MDZ7994272.1 aspartyl/asparaginyl beta-hydroxylase domain-containing protein [Nostoc sp. EspVER01]
MDKQSLELSFFLLFLKLLKLLSPQGNIDRFENALKSYITLSEESTSNPAQKMSAFLYPGITHKPWYEPHDNDILNLVSNKLQQGFNDIENEWLAYISSGCNIVSRFNASNLFTSLKDDDWKAYLLWKEGNFTQIGLSHFPKTVDILSKLEPFLYPFGHIEFYVMKPGVVLPPHTDNINTSLTCHLALTIPEKCGISVGGKTQSWIKGRTLFFDDSFEHEAWNKSQEERVVLSLDLYHPEMTKIEKNLLQFVLKKFNFSSEEDGVNKIPDTQDIEKVLDKQAL